MFNPIEDLIKEFKEMNDSLSHKLDTIIHRMDTLIAIEYQNRVDFYGDGK